MRNSDLKSRFIDRWCGVFAQLLDAQIHGSPLPVVAKLRRRFQNLAEVGGEKVTQQFFHEAI